MDASGEVADLMVKESIQLTEESIKLLAAGCKNLTAFLYALAVALQTSCEKFSYNLQKRNGA